jgi:small conductance mechanosensitive channel
MFEWWNRLQAGLPGWVGSAAAVAALVLAGWLFYRYLVGSAHRALVRLGVSGGVVSFLFNSLRAVVVFAVVLAVLRQLGVETTSLLALLGAAGAALALSLQAFMGNFAAGLVLLGERMVRLGDVIESGDVRGRVVEMLPLHVVVETADGLRVLLPNTTLVNNPLRNHSALPTRRVQWLLPLPAGLDLGPVKGALRACLAQDARVLPAPPPALFVRDWAADKTTLAVQAWAGAADAQAVQDELLERLAAAVERCVQEARKPEGPPPPGVRETPA